MTLADRITKSMNEKGIKPPVLARHLKKPPATVHGWLSGRVKFISYELLDKVADYFGVDSKWLNTGKGQKHPGDSTTIPQDISFENMIYIELKGIKEQLKAINEALIASLLDK